MNPLLHLLTKVKYLLHCESKLTDEQKALHQWQLLTSRGSINYIVGKGGVNTCFYVLGENERVVCYPQELVDMLTKLSKEKYSEYVIVNQAKKRLSKAKLTLAEALEIKPKSTGAYIVGVTDSGKMSRLYYSSKGLNGITWNRFKQ